MFAIFHAVLRTAGNRFARLSPIVATLACVACAPGNHALNADRLMLGGDPAAVGKTLVVAPGEVVLESAIGYGSAIRTLGDVEVVIAGEGGTFPAGSVLEDARVTGPAADAMPGSAAYFCANKDFHLVQNTVTALTLGLGGMFSRTASTTRLCMADSDADMALDHALLIGARMASDKAPQPMTPVPYEKVSRVAMPGESAVRIRYLGKVGLLGKLGFELSVLEEGDELAFNNRRVLVQPEDLPETVSRAGGFFTVLSHDPATDAVTVRIDRAIPSGSYGLTYTTTTRYVPIYMPR